MLKELGGVKEEKMSVKEETDRIPLGAKGSLSNPYQQKNNNPSICRNSERVIRSQKQFKEN